MNINEENLYFVTPNIGLILKPIIIISIIGIILISEMTNNKKSQKKMKNYIKVKNILTQFIKFGLVGAINTVLSYIITNIGFYVIGLHEQISNIIAFIITVFISFILNRKFVFKHDEYVSFWKSLFKVYTSYSITGLFLTGILLYVEEQLFGIPHYIATLLNLIVTIPINFILNKFWAFNSNNKKEDL